MVKLLRYRHYQHATAFPDLSVTENIFMGQEILTKFGTYNRRLMKKLAKQYIEPFSSDIDVTKPMSSLSVAQQQMVEIAKALSRNARILILDEPTASLTKYECEKLYGIVENLRDNGVSMIFITHRFEDMYRLATRVTVLRDAKYIGSWDVCEFGAAAAATVLAINEGRCDGSVGSSFEYKGKTYEVVENTDGGTRVVSLAPYFFHNGNMAEWKDKL